MRIILLFLIFFIISASINQDYALGSAVVLNKKNDEVLFAKDEMSKIYPASLTKVMTLYTVAKNIRNGKIDMYDEVEISETASSQQKSSMGLEKDSRVFVKDLMLMSGIISANDAAYALGEEVGGGSLENFVQMMNQNASDLKMYDTNFVNSNGLHSDNQYSSAMDIATLLNEFSKNYRGYLGAIHADGFFYEGKFYQPKNDFGLSYKCIKAFKTGFTSASKYNIAAYLSCKNYELIAVVTGSETSYQRNFYIKEIVDYSIKKINDNISDSKKNLKFYLENENNKIYSHSLDLAIRQMSIPFLLIDMINQENSLDSIKEIAKTIWKDYFSEYTEKIYFSKFPIPKLKNSNL